MAVMAIFLSPRACVQPFILVVFRNAPQFFFLDNINDTVNQLKYTFEHYEDVRDIMLLFASIINQEWRRKGLKQRFFGMQG